MHMEPSLEFDLDEGFSGSQSATEIIDEYFTSKNSNNNDSFEFWNDKMSQFPGDGLF